MPDPHTCPACSAAETVDLFRARDHLVSGREYLIRRCVACGMGWTADPPAEEKAGRYYLSGEYISHTDRKKSFSDHLYHLARNYMLGRKYRLTTTVTGKRSGTLLDIGCGTGYYAAFMKKRGWQVSGIEPNDLAREYTSSHFGISVTTPDRIRDFASGSLDCITFWHVLEHLYDPGRWLNEVRRLLKDDGRCIIALPNFSSADAEWFGNRWAALDVPRHLWHFTPDAFKQFIGARGFTCEMIVPLPLDLFYISSLSYRNNGNLLPLARGVLTGLVIALRNLLRKEKASSLIYVISKGNV
jgi:2-polyprenyl-3-methyl-5-hydroxy-6-metoxy-1,4-benzoquinol methylase